MDDCDDLVVFSLVMRNVVFVINLDEKKKRNFP